MFSDQKSAKICETVNFFITLYEGGLSYFVSFSATLFTLSIPNNYIVSQRTGTAKTLPSLFPGMAKTLPSQGWKSMNVYKCIQNSLGRQRLCHPGSLGWQSLCHPRDLGIVNFRILFCGFWN